MRNNDQSTVISLKSLLENILRTNIHMVCRFVKCKKIIWFEHQLGHSKTRTLTAAEHSHLLIDILTLEKEGTENITKLQTDVSHSDSVESLEHSIILIKDILLILSIISDINIVSDLRISSLRIKLIHNHAHQSGLTLTVSSDKSHLLTPAHLDLSIIKDNLLTIAHLHIHSLIGNVTRTRCRRELNCQS